ncbi:tyrosine-type recombinase/integrase [Kitasatospora sp. NPDC101235]|uniref:tyrosine-type recombinase/integrase n=1 Tax=Kitasatospora sp. NPDC101235 TaxID=3364101 RepID=UPI00380A4305
MGAAVRPRRRRPDSAPWTGVPPPSTVTSSWAPTASPSTPPPSADASTSSAKAGLPHVTIHDLRHLAATLALEGNVSMAVISKTLRHSTLSTTTNIYSHLTWDVARAAVNTIEARLHLVEARTRHDPHAPAHDVGLPNPVFSHAA